MVKFIVNEDIVVFFAIAKKVAEWNVQSYSVLILIYVRVLTFVKGPVLTRARFSLTRALRF